jgi:hypothetical protein
MARRSNASFASELRAAGEHALTLFEHGLADEANGPRPSPRATILKRDAR